MGVRAGFRECEQMFKCIILLYMFPQLQTFNLINSNKRMEIYPIIRIDHEVSFFATLSHFLLGILKSSLFGIYNACTIMVGFSVSLTKDH